jgi:hypothetical protein
MTRLRLPEAGEVLIENLKEEKVQRVFLQAPHIANRKSQILNESMDHGLQPKYLQMTLKMRKEAATRLKYCPITAFRWGTQGNGRSSELWSESSLERRRQQWTTISRRSSTLVNKQSSSQLAHLQVSYAATLCTGLPAWSLPLQVREAPIA